MLAQLLNEDLKKKANYITSYSFHTLEIVNQVMWIALWDTVILSLWPYRELMVLRMHGWIVWLIIVYAILNKAFQLSFYLELLSIFCFDAAPCLYLNTIYFTLSIKTV